ncbi:hypothetical protein C8R42DRAFT_716314 [Lentinula raphanica]|nr:hypothetical protein C8R42DRAFT_716314 [Lentinula raphanica]
MYPKHLASTVFFTLCIFPSTSMGAPMVDLSAKTIEGRTIQVIDASAPLMKIKDRSTPRANPFAQFIDARSPRIIPNEPVSQLTRPPPHQATDKFLVTFDNPGIRTTAGVVIRGEALGLMDKARVHLRRDLPIEFGEQNQLYPYIQPDWSPDEIKEQQFDITVTGGGCDPRCKGELRLRGISVLKDDSGQTIVTY